MAGLNRGAAGKLPGNSTSLSSRLVPRNHAPEVYDVKMAIGGGIAVTPSRLENYKTHLFQPHRKPSATIMMSSSISS